MVFLDICISLFEFYVFASFYRITFYGNNLLSNNKKHHYLILGMACSVLIIGVVIIRHIFSMSPLILTLFTFSYLIGLSHLYQAKLKDRIFYTSILILLGLGSELVVGYILDSILPPISSITFDYIFGMVCSKIIFFLLSRSLALICRKDKKSIPLFYWIILMLVPAISILELHAVVQYASDTTLTIHDNPLLVISGILIINILLFVVYDIIASQYEKAMQRERELIFFENTQKRYELLVQHGLEMAAFIHDTKKHLSTIASLIENNEPGNCLEYINDLGIKCSQHIAYERILPQNQALSIVLDTKRKEAIANGIRVEYQIGISDRIPVSDTELCMLFVNACDNAIRACNEYAGDKKIFFEIQQTYNRLVIQLQNTSNPVSIGLDGLCKTTKINTGRHGFGLANMQSIVNTYNGNMKLSYKDNVFTLTILFFL